MIRKERDPAHVDEMFERRQRREIARLEYAKSRSIRPRPRAKAISRHDLLNPKYLRTLGYLPHQGPREMARRVAHAK